MSDVPKKTQRFPWRLFWLLFVAGVLSVVASIPIAIDLFGPTIAAAPAPSIPFPVIVAIGVVQNLALLAAMIFVGLKLGRTLGLGAPVLEAWLNHDLAGTNWKEKLRVGLLVGVGVGAILLAIIMALVPALPNLPFVSAAKVAIWKRILVCFYGGIYEELLTRLSLLTLIAWIASKVWRPVAGKVATPPFWIANLIVAILFGLGHLPSASLVMPITPLVVAAALLLNGIAAVAFGLLYRRHGLESAMVAHFTADFVLYVIGASLL